MVEKLEVSRLILDRHITDIAANKTWCMSLLCWLQEICYATAQQSSRIQAVYAIHEVGLPTGYILMHFVLIAADNFQNLRIMEISS